MECLWWKNVETLRLTYHRVLPTTIQWTDYIETPITTAIQPVKASGFPSFDTAVGGTSKAMCHRALETAGLSGRRLLLGL